MSLAAGTLVAERFRLGELLGSGGSATVYAAIDLQTGADVAVKVLHPHLAGRPAARDVFLAEARRVRRLRHPNLVAVVDASPDDAPSPSDDLVWIALERAPGTSLSAHVARHGPLEHAEAMAVVDGVLRALEGVHAHGLVHRDISPSNIVVMPDDSRALRSEGVRVLDFGLAGPAGTTVVGSDELLSVDATGRAGVMGNVNYMSPEQVRGEGVDERGDLYQCGALLHFALTGRPPFVCATTGETMRSHLSAPPPRPSVSDSRIPRGFDRIVVRAMLKEPGDRYASAAAMRAALAAVGAPGGAAAPAKAGETADAAPRRRAEASTALAPTFAAASAAEGSDGVTRVMGRTLIPARVATPAATWRKSGFARARRLPSRSLTWTAALAGATTIALALIFAASAPPTQAPDAGVSAPPAAVVEPEPSAPAETPREEPTVDPVSAQAPVPDLLGLTFADADLRIVERGLVRGDVSFVDSATPRDVVVGSDPAPGSLVAPGSAVRLVLASGRNVVPDVAGLESAAAESAVRAAGFAPVFVDRPGPVGVARGIVFETTPAAGSTAAHGDPVTISRATTPSLTTPTPTPDPTATPTPVPTP